MENSRTKNSIYNFGSSLLIRILQLSLSFASRTVFIYVLGAAYLGLNGLFSNILSFLSLSELGIGSAILQKVFSLYWFCHYRLRFVFTSFPEQDGKSESANTRKFVSGLCAVFNAVCYFIFFRWL